MAKDLTLSGDERSQRLQSIRPYSYRNTFIGSTRDARNTGAYAASNVTASSWSS
jgi:hypothetical protein